MGPAMGGEEARALRGKSRGRCADMKEQGRMGVADRFDFVLDHLLVLVLVALSARDG